MSERRAFDASHKRHSSCETSLRDGHRRVMPCLHARRWRLRWSLIRPATRAGLHCFSRDGAHIGALSRVVSDRLCALLAAIGHVQAWEWAKALRGLELGPSARGSDALVDARSLALNSMPRHYFDPVPRWAAGTLLAQGKGAIAIDARWTSCRAHRRAALFWRSNL